MEYLEALQDTSFEQGGMPDGPPDQSHIYDISHGESRLWPPCMDPSPSPPPCPLTVADRQRPTEPFDVSVPVWPDVLKRRTIRDGAGVTVMYIHTGMVHTGMVPVVQIVKCMFPVPTVNASRIPLPQPFINDTN